MRQTSTIILTLFFMSVAVAQKKTTPPGKEQVQQLCGCFEVEFKYAETFSPDKNYKYHDREAINGGIEYVFPVDSANNRLVLQHLLVVTDDIIVKHWRETWTYEDPLIWTYKGDKVWQKQQLPLQDVKGKWMQSVWEVSDAPRYQGASEWIHADNKIFWLNTADAPLPRREYTVRNDYNILKRTNRLLVAADGWTHEQDNQKIIRKDGIDQLLVEEKGINTYKRTDESKCAAAKTYWVKNKTYWTTVRSVWDAWLAAHNTIVLKDKVDGQVLHDRMFAQAKDFSEGKIKPAELEAKVRETIELYLARPEATAAVR